MSTSNIKLAVPFFLVKNMEISLKFYTGQLGFVMTNKWIPREKIEWCWLRRDGVSLMLQELQDETKFYVRNTKGDGVSICFQCVDALALYQEFTTMGVIIKEPFVGNNRWV